MTLKMDLNQLNDWLQDKCPIVPHIQLHYPDVDLKDDGNGQWSAPKCPWGSHKDKRGSSRLNVNSSGPWRCWSCDDVRGYGAIGWEMQEHSCDFNEALRRLAALYAFDIPFAKPLTPAQIADNDKKQIAQRILNGAAIYYHNQIDDDARAYYNDRGLTDKYIDDHLLGWAGNKRDGLAKVLLLHFDAADILASGLCFNDKDGKMIDRWHNGYILPYHINRNNVSYFAFRNGTPDAEPKYKKLPADSESSAVQHAVLGLYNLTSTVHKPILMVEGIFDYHLAQQEFGDNFIVISPGTVEPSNKQLDMILKCLMARKVQTKIVICNDADDSGRNGAVKTGTAIQDMLADANFDSIPEIFVALLQKDFDGTSVDLADYIKEGRVEDLKYRIYTAAPLESVQQYLDRKNGSAYSYAFDGKTLNPQRAAYFYTAEGNFFINKDDTLLRCRNGIYIADRGYTAQQFSYMLGSASTHSRVDNCVKYVQQHYRLADSAIDNPPNLIPFKNKWIDIDKVDLSNIGSIEHAVVPISAHTLMTREVQANFDLESASPNFDKFLDQIAPDCRTLIYEMIGYCFHNSSDMQKAFFLYGVPGSGKSTLLKIIQDILGDGNFCNHTIHFLEENQFALAKLDGKMANICADASSKSLRSIDVFKRLVVGDTQELEQKGKDTITGAPTATQIHSMNDFPPVFTNISGFIERICFVVFPTAFRDTDTEKNQSDLVADLLKERDAIATNSLICYLHAVARKERVIEVEDVDQRGFSMPEVSKRKRDEYIREINPLQTFITGCLTLEVPPKDVADDYKPAFISRKVLRDHYKDYSEMNGEKKVSNTKLYRAITQHFGIPNEPDCNGRCDYSDPNGPLQRGFKGLVYNPIEEVDEYVQIRDREKDNGQTYISL